MSVTSPRSVLPICLAIVLAGCVGGLPVGSNQPSVDRACNGATWIAFYALDSPVENRIWDSESVVVGFDLSAGAHVLLVAYENDSIRGVRPYSTDRGVHVDGLRIPLDHRLSGNHTVRVVMYGDVNQNEQFDADRDVPCQHEGEVIQTQPRTLNFSSFTTNSTALS